MYSHPFGQSLTTHQRPTSNCGGNIILTPGVLEKRNLWSVPMNQPLVVERNQKAANDSLEQTPSNDVRLNSTIRDKRNVPAGS